MRKRGIRIVLLALLLFATLALIGWWVLQPREPSYQGKSLSAWLWQYGTNHWSTPDSELEKQAEAALNHFGTNATPIFLSMMSSKMSPVRVKMLSHIPTKWLVSVHVTTLNDYRMQMDARRRLGAYGIIALGPDAQPAVPALIALLNDKEADVRYCSVFALRSLGPVAKEALPSLVRCLDDSEFTVQDDAVIGLGTIHEQPERVVPVIMAFLAKHQGDAILSSDALAALRQFGPQAKAAVPLLLRLLDSSQPSLRSDITNTLKEIDPETAAKARAE